MGRVAITGVGLITSIGIQLDEFAKSLFARKCGANQIQDEQSPNIVLLRSRTAYRVTTPLENLIPTKKAYLDRCSALTIASCWLAIKDGGLEITEEEAPNTGICHGTAYGCEDSMLIFWERIEKRGFRGASSIMFTHAYMNTPISLAAIEFNLKGYHCCYSAGMVSGAQAIAGAAMAIIRSLARRILAGGAEAFSGLPFMANCLAGELSPNDDGEELMRPFDVSRNGWVMGEGACMLLLEDEAIARERNAKVLGYISGIGISQASNPNDIGSLSNAIMNSMKYAMCMAGIEPNKIGWICASANGSKKVDEAEAIAIERLFGNAVLVSSVKTAVGETVGAGGAISVCAAIASLLFHKIPPTLFTTKPCANIRLTVEEAMPWNGDKPVLANSIDKGGTAISILVIPPQ
ncbi:MAG: beta-ketoacyl synthase N-terminal-like domain-containing protein [Armatimonadota bacterium]|nr:hypothetical protein [Armatimonadota bacterium]MCX7777878.1 hypothetical protein [Armatimonadota bacterium]MDW8025962.1 beta-ketoacyl synthase N-terminal-like domain-containing protein [Armatimonadota bacterium]